MKYQQKYKYHPKKGQQINDELRLRQCINIIGYQNIINLLLNENTQPSRFKTKNWVEINDDRRGTYNTKKIKFKTAMLKSSLYLAIVMHTCEGNY